MEDSLPNTSVLPPKSSFTLDSKSVILHIATIILVSVLLGGLFWFVLQRVSFNRIVVFNQPPSPSILIKSVRLEKPGFVVISVEEEGGWRIVGKSFYLAPGAYQNLVVDIGIPYFVRVEHKDVTTGNFVPHNYTARLYIDRGVPDTFDDGFVDEPVRTSRGAVYQKRFWTKSSDGNIREFLSWFIDNPIGNTIDMLFPY